jgi:glycerophosphoryl diester phosphodiesterase
MSRTKDRPLVIAHRGASAYRPENTLPAYALAVEQRADMIEIDLHRTRDGAIVITHDADLAHFGAEGAIVHKTLTEIRLLDASRGCGDPLPVPLLEEVLDAFGPQIPLNLELKCSPEGDYPGLETATLEALEARGLSDSILFSSFRDSVLARLREALPTARLATLVDFWQPDRMLERAEAVGAEAVNPHFLLVTPELVRDAHAAGLAVYAWTVDDSEQMERLLDLGVDGLFTNCPDRMRTLIDTSS